MTSSTDPTYEPLPGQLSTSILIAARDQYKEDISNLVDEFREGDNIDKAADFANTLKMMTDALSKVQQMLDTGVQLAIIRG